MTEGIDGLGSLPGIGSTDNSEPMTNTQSQGQQIEDQIQASDDIAALLYMMTAKSPLVMPPENEMSLDPGQMKGDVLASLANKFNDLQNEVVQNILDSWIAQIEESAKRTREWLQSPAYQVWLENKFPHLDPTQIRQQVEIQSELRNVRGYAAQAIGSSSKGGAVPGEMAAIALGGLLLGGGVVPITAPFGAGVGLIGAMTGMGAGMGIVRSVVSGDILSAQLGYLTGMLLAGIGTKSSINALFGGMANGKLNQAAFANEFSSRVLNMVTHRGFEAHVLSRIVAHLSGEEGVSGEQLVSTIKIAMLANAIAMMKKTEEGWLGPKMGELFLSGGKQLDLPPGSLQAKLYGEIARELSRLSPNQRNKMVSELESYFESEPDIQALTDVNSTFAAIALRVPQNDINEK